MATNKLEEEMITEEDRIEERTTIEFKGGLLSTDLAKLFKYIAKHLPCEIRYTKETGHLVDGLHHGGEEIYTRTNYIGVSGSISSKNANSSFECKTIKNSLFSNMLKFIPIPGYAIEEHRPEVVQLWDDVRQQINNYFESRG